MLKKDNINALLTSRKQSSTHVVNSRSHFDFIVTTEATEGRCRRSAFICLLHGCTVQIIGAHTVVMFVFQCSDN